MAIDKETLIKHRFWVGLGIFVPLILMAVGWLYLFVEDSLSAEKRAVEEKLSKLSAVKQPLNENDLKELKKRADFLEDRREKIWSQAWELQKGIQSWPSQLEAIANQSFGDRIDNSLLATARRKDVYLPQLEEMAGNFKAKGKVGDREREFETTQFNGGWKKVLKYVEEWAGEKPSKATEPSSEEVWLAQEDLWVQRELLKALNDANNFIARLNPAKGDTDTKQGELFRQHFENNIWHMDLVLAKAPRGYVFRGSLKNVTKRRLPIGTIYFLVTVNKENPVPVILPVEGVTLAAGQEIKIPDFAWDQQNNPDGLHAVSQILEGRLAPVRRIESIVLGSQSHRTFEPRLKPPRSSKAITRPDPTAKGGMPPVPMPGGPAVATGAARTETYGLLLERYSDVTDQVRRIPVAMVILVDESSIPEVMASLANSKLRLQTTQISWEHFRGSLASSEAAADKGPLAIGVAPKPAAENEEQQTNLVELVIYGVASMYERYVPNPKKPAAGAPVAAR